MKLLWYISPAKNHLIYLLTRRTSRLFQPTPPLPSPGNSNIININRIPHRPQRRQIRKRDRPKRSTRCQSQLLLDPPLGPLVTHLYDQRNTLTRVLGLERQRPARGHAQRVVPKGKLVLSAGFEAQAMFPPDEVGG